MANRTPPRLGPEPRLPELEPPRRKPSSPYDDEGLPRVVTGKVRGGYDAGTVGKRSYARNSADNGEGRSIGRFVLFAVIGLVGLAATAAAALTIFLPVDLVRDRVVRDFKAKTGRDLVIAGATSFSVYPNVTVSLGNVSVSAPPEMAGAPTFEVDSIEASVKLWPLLSREVVVDTLLLRRPVLDMRIDAQGRRSWDFAAALPPGWPNDRVRFAQAGGGAASKELRDFSAGASAGALEKRLGSSKLENVSLSDVRLVDGLLRYSDERNGSADDVTLNDLSVNLQSIASPLAAKGSIGWRGETLNFSGRLTPFRAILDDQPAHVVMTAIGRPVEAAFDGTVLLGRTAALEGRLTAKTSSVAALSAWLGKPIIGGSADGPLDMAARIKSTGSEITLSETRLDFEKMSATGTLAVDARGARPFLKGTIQLTELDLDRLAAIKPGKPGPVVARALPQPRPASRGTGSAPQSIEDLLKEQPARAPQVRGYTRQTGWSNDALDFAGLGLFDADLRVGFGNVSWHDVKTGAGQMTLALKDRKARFTIEEMQLYDGKARGIVTLDGTGATTVVGANLTADGVSALPFLKNASQFDWLSGRARVHVAVGAQGQSERQMIQTLNGKAEISVADGTLIGFNIPQMLQSATTGRIPSFERVATDKTGFSEMAATFQINGGIAQNQDLRIISPAFRITGAGAVNISGGQLDYVVKPKVTGPAAGQPGAQGGGINLSAIDVPVKIQGPWEKPQIAPDLSAVLRDPNAIIDAAKQLGRNSDVKDAVKGILGGDPEQTQKAKNLLNQLLKR